MLSDYYLDAESTAVKDMRTEPVTTEEEYSKNPGLSKDDITELRKWMKAQPHLPMVNGEYTSVSSDWPVPQWYMIQILNRE